MTPSPMVRGCKTAMALADGSRDSKFKVVGDATKPWECWPGNVSDWSEPVPTTFS